METFNFKYINLKKVKNMVDNMSNTKRAKPRYEWEVVEPKHIDKDKNWLIKMAINHKIAKIDRRGCKNHASENRCVKNLLVFNDFMLKKPPFGGTVFQ